MNHQEAIRIHEERERAIRMVHVREEFGDCVEDGEPYPCKTIRVLDWSPAPV